MSVAISPRPTPVVLTEHPDDNDNPFGRFSINADVTEVEFDLLFAAREGRWPHLPWDSAEYRADAIADGFTLGEQEQERAQYLQERARVLQNLRAAIAHLEVTPC